MPLARLQLFDPDDNKFVQKAILFPQIFQEDLYWLVPVFIVVKTYTTLYR